jgi:hypothetical protein
MAATKKKKPAKPKRLVPTNVRFDDESLEELRLHAALEDRPLANLIYRIVRLWLDEHRHLIQEKG